MKKLQEWLFYGNYFYGLCAIALSIESGLQQKIGLNNLQFYILIFFGTVVYYTKAYSQSEIDAHQNNPRGLWYRKNAKYIKMTQIIFLIIIFILMAALCLKFYKTISALSLSDIFLVCIFPIIAILYYGLEHFSNANVQLRRIGWLKPFIIGFCWAGAVSVYPAIYHQLQIANQVSFPFFSVLLFVKNFMFITVLSIMFDIKDYAADSNQQLKTFVVTYGLRRTIFYIIVPLSVLGLCSFLGYAIGHQFSLGKIGLNIIPFLLILIVSFLLQKRQSIFFYLFIIDGLMLLKGICGSIAMLYF